MSRPSNSPTGRAVALLPHTQRRQLRVEPLEERNAPAVITVTSLADNTTVDGLVTLREAIEAANTETGVDGSAAGSGADTIVFAPTIAGGTVDLTTAASPIFFGVGGPSALTITSPITITGTGETIERGVTEALRLFQIGTGGSLTLENLTLSNGLAQGGNGGDGADGGGAGGGAAGLGGAILNQGVLNLFGCVLADNQAIGGNGGSVVSGGSGNHGGGGGGMGGDASTDGNGGGPNRGLVGVSAFPNGTGAGVSGGGGGGFGGGAVSADGTGGNGGFGGGGGGGGGSLGANGLGSESAGESGGFGGGGGGSGTTIGGGFIRSGGFGGGVGANAGGGGAGLGGAVFNDAGTVVAVDCTFTGNSVIGGRGGNSSISNTAAGGGGSGLGAGLFNLNGAVTITNCTFAANSVTAGEAGNPPSPGFNQPGTAAGGALYSRQEPGLSGSASLLLNNSLLVTSAGGPDGVNDGGTIAGSGNLTTSSPSLATIAFPIADPRLGALQDNGGPTPTMALLPGSPAIDSGTTAGAPPFDQRGFHRVVGSAADVGAYEFQPPTTSVTLTSSANSVAAGSPITLTATVSALAVGSNTPNGSVTFRVDGQVLGTPVKLTGGAATLSGVILTPGSHTITADYGGFALGDFAFNAGTSAPLTEMVTAPPGSGQKPPPSGSPVRSSPFLELFFNLLRIEPQLLRGFQLAVADVTGDGTPDVVLVTRLGTFPFLVVIDGLAGQVSRCFFPFGLTSHSEPALMIADVNHDGVNDVIVNAPTLHGPRLRAFDVLTCRVLAQV